MGRDLDDDLVGSDPAELFAHCPLTGTQVSVKGFKLCVKVGDLARKAPVFFTLRIQLSEQTSVAWQTFVAEHHHGDTDDGYN